MDGIGRCISGTIGKAAMTGIFLRRDNEILSSSW